MNSKNLEQLMQSFAIGIKIKKHLKIRFVHSFSSSFVKLYNQIKALGKKTLKFLKNIFFLLLNFCLPSLNTNRSLFYLFLHFIVVKHRYFAAKHIHQSGFFYCATTLCSTLSFLSVKLPTF